MNEKFKKPIIILIPVLVIIMILTFNNSYFKYKKCEQIINNMSSTWNDRLIEDYKIVLDNYIKIKNSNPNSKYLEEISSLIDKKLAIYWEETQKDEDGNNYADRVYYKLDSYLTNNKNYPNIDKKELWESPLFKTLIAFRQNYKTLSYAIEEQKDGYLSRAYDLFGEISNESPALYSIAQEQLKVFYKDIAYSELEAAKTDFSQESYIDAKFHLDNVIKFNPDINEAYDLKDLYEQKYKLAVEERDKRFEEYEKEQEKLRIEEEKKKKEEKKREGVRIGMTKQEVLDSSWGSPIDINTTTNKYGVREQWVYGNGNYLYFEDGILVTIQN